MESRTDRYNAKLPKYRSSINQDLYKTIHDMSEYSNIEGVANLGITNEIDISKIKDMLKSRENYHQEREYYNIVKEPLKIENIDISVPDKEKNYDIRDVLSKAKCERVEDNKYHNLKNPENNIIEKLNLSKAFDNKNPEDSEELACLINTITNTSLLNKLGDQELSLNIFDDLKSNNNTQLTNYEGVRSALEEEKNIKKETTIDDTSSLDKSFFTSSMNFNTSDFDQLKDISKNIKKSNRLVQILLIVISICLIIGIVFLIINFIK